MADVTRDLAKNEIVPDVVHHLPEGLSLLQVNYPSGVAAEMGNILTPRQVKDQPSVQYEFEKGAYYTLILADPDAPSRRDAKFRCWKHWVVCNISGGKVSSGDVLAAYIGAGPPEKTGLHRYVFLLCKQQGGQTKFEDETKLSNKQASTRGKWSVDTFIKNYQLEVVASNFFEAEWDDYVPELYKNLTE
eukprot:TRINITY_DN24567_c0_g1_i1.p1 TRINITY_DN24567_c0_g1~~TRINITY_DN24567_c0_g1_i1.p1  ORF type:complete len:208 (+),score=38.65 TRINITY_DN24567_c0_g1_i1:58-624(+)